MKEADKTIKAQAPIVTLSGGKVTINQATLISSVNLTLTASSVTGVIGLNGSGKSTLVKVLARQLPLSAGTLHLGDEAYDKYNDRAFSRRVAYLPQYTPSAPGMTVRELVSLGRFPWHGALGRFTEQDNTAVERALEQTDTLPFAHRYIDLLSGGERQRCWLAMLLAQEAEVMLLDEPLSALDARFQSQIMALIRDIAVSRNMAVLVVLHDVNLASRYCHKIVAMKSGRLIWEGDSFQVMDSAVLEPIFDTPMTVLTSPESGAKYAFSNPEKRDFL
ncbi:MULTISPECIES: ABC transporter ATP-binding protein [unclassified Ketobacter]|mgnify:CR=1 FL=1|uniref:ABC transporter ATP-binding protein n=1 Tax=unclassified Ketobacter TaxID=2639109 RepID=UPI0025C4DB17|nr:MULTISPECIES: ABC transporter ATP-binding protein [unclassified Ketobacter]